MVASILFCVLGLFIGSMACCIALAILFDHEAAGVAGCIEEGQVW